MQKLIRSKYNRFAASVFLTGIVALASTGIANAAAYKVTGQWDFEQGDLRATLGAPMQYGDLPTETAVKDHTSFGTTASFGIPNIGGQVAKVMKYSRDTNPPVPIGPRGYVTSHGMSPNGGGTNVNQFTMILDFMIPDLHELGTQYNTVVKWEEPDNWGRDGSISIRAHDLGGPNTGGIGISGQYAGDGNVWIIGGQWTRLVVAVDMVGDTNDPADGTITYYLDGVRFGQMTTGERWGFDRRHAIGPFARLYADGEGDNEVNTVYVNSLQFREGTMTEEQALALGPATASGIPIPPNPVKGQWDFEQGDLRATVGTPMQYGDLPTETAVQSHTSFGTTTSFGIPDIGGQIAHVMKYERDTNPPVPIGPRGYLTQHGMSPNGGGTNVNQHTMVLDFMIPDLHQGDNYNTVVKWEDIDNWARDGSISIRANDIGGPNTGGIGISGQYTGDGVTWIIGGQWQRLVVAVDMVGDTNDLADGTITYYLDGVRFGQMITGERWGFDRRHAIGPVVRMYADGEADNEVNTVYVNSLQFRDYTMTPEEAAALGAASASGIPIPPTSNPALAVNRNGTNLTLSWDVTVSGSGYDLESADSLSTPTWTPVPGVVNNSVTVPIGAGNKYFRLKKP